MEEEDKEEGMRIEGEGEVRRMEGKEEGGGGSEENGGEWRRMEEGGGGKEDEKRGKGWRSIVRVLHTLRVTGSTPNLHSVVRRLHPPSNSHSVEGCYLLHVPPPPFQLTS